MTNVQLINQSIMESIQEMEHIIQEAVSKAIAPQMVIHIEKVEKNIADHRSVFSSLLELIEKKIDKFQKSQGVVHNKLDAIDGLLKGLMKENVKIKKEHETLVKQAKDTQRTLEVAQQKLDGLEQYVRKSMLEINGFQRVAKEDPIQLTLALAEKIEVPLCEDESEACHRLSANEKAGIIVEFASRKKRDQFLEKRKLLKNVSIKDLGFQSKSPGKIFINESLTAKRKALIKELKEKKEERKFKFVWSRKGTVFIRRDENSRPIRISTILDLNKLNE